MEFEVFWESRVAENGEFSGFKIREISLIQDKDSDLHF